MEAKKYNLTINQSTVYQPENCIDTLTINENKYNIFLNATEYSYHEKDTLHITINKNTQNTGIEYHGQEAYPTKIIARFITSKDNDFLECDIILLSRGKSYHMCFNEGIFTLYYENEKGETTPILNYGTKNSTINIEELNTFLNIMLSDILTINISQTAFFYVYPDPLAFISKMLDNIWNFLSSTDFPQEVQEYLTTFLAKNNNLNRILTKNNNS